MGNVYRFKVHACNAAGCVESPIRGATLASLPLKPPVPVIDATASGANFITVDVSTFPTLSNGGCSVRSYDIQRDDGYGGNFVSLIGATSPFIMTRYTALGLLRSRTYRLRYRVRNCIGWGPFSDEVTELAAIAPSAPPQPMLDSVVSATTIELNLFPTKDNGGSAVTTYDLYRNLGTDGSVF